MTPIPPVTVAASTANIFTYNNVAGLIVLVLWIFIPLVVGVVVWMAVRAAVPVWWRRVCRWKKSAY